MDERATIADLERRLAEAEAALRANNDHDARRRAETALRESGDRQTFLLRLSDALRAEPDADAVANRAIRMMLEQLKLDRCYITANRLDEDRADILYQVGNDSVHPLPNFIHPSAFPAALQIWRSRTLVIDDIGATPGLTDDDRRNIAAFGTCGVISSAVRRGEGNPLWAIVAVSATPRFWNKADVALAEEATERTWAAMERIKAEAALRESEEKFRTLFESIDEGFLLIELVHDEAGEPVDYRYLKVNPAYLRQTGLSDPSGQMASVYDPIREPAWLANFTAIARTGESVRFEQFHKRSDRWYSVYTSRVGGSGSRLVANVFADITERKRAENILRESEERQGFLLELSDTLRAQTSPEAIGELACRMVAEQMNVDRCYIAHLPRYEGRGRIGPEFRAPGLAPLAGEYRFEAFPEAMKQLETGPLVIRDVLYEESLSDADKTSIATAMGLHALLAAVLRKGQGNYFWCMTAATTDPRDWTDGELRLLEEVAERTWAVIERARAEAALRESEERFQQFANASAAGLWIRDADTLAMEFVSPAIGAIYGVEPDGLRGDVKRWAAMVVPDDRDAALGHLDTARHGDVAVHEFRIQRPSDGAFRWIRNTDFPLRDDSHIPRIGGIAEDVTEARLAAEHSAVLLAELQHRVRNIMALLRSITNRTAERAESVREYRDLMMGRLLASARVQALLTRAANLSVGIASIVHDEVSVQAQHESQYGLDGPDVTLSPKAAEVLTLAIHELATNAVKYGALSVPDGKVTVRWSTFEKRGGPWLAFDWTEEGAPPRPVPTPDAPRRRGFGSELIEARIPYELRGRGQVTVEPGGARCHLEFPLQEGTSILETGAPRRATVFGGAIDMTGEPELTGRRVLVVEDDYYLATDTARALGGAGADVMGPCATEEDARAELEAQRPDAVVVDINLGPGPSFKLAEALKDCGIPFVFTTGYDAEVIPAEFEGVERLEKPLQLRQIVGAVARLTAVG